MPSRTIAITTTVPIEIILAAGYSPLDLNNRFINSADPLELLSQAEKDGYPDTCCAWIKGIYSAALAEDSIELVVGVDQGDCSNTGSMLGTLQEAGKRVLTFPYPTERSEHALRRELSRFASELGTTLERAEKVRGELLPLRAKLKELDELTWREGKVTGEENHTWLVSSSDLNSDPDGFEKRLDSFLNEARSRRPQNRIRRLRAGYLGVPPLIKDLYRGFGHAGLEVVFNEVQRQFAMLEDFGGLVPQYLAYTYPYLVQDRLKDIQMEVGRRDIQVLVHYTQSFCHRAIDDIVLRKHLSVPMLRIETDHDLYLTAKQRTQIEAFKDLAEAIRP